MRHFAFSLTCLLALSACDIAGGIYSAVRGGDEAEAEATAPAGKLTRKAVEDSNAAVIALYPNARPESRTYYYALANNADTGSWGKSGLTALTTRGSLIISQYIAGNDLLGVRINPDDPVQFARAPANWPASIKRVYELPGGGISGDERVVNCSYAQGERSTLVIVEWAHQVTEISESCTGDDLAFENQYWVDDTGAIWRSVQWVGDNPTPMILDIIEPLD